MYAMYDMGRKALWRGPEGQGVMDRKVDTSRTGRSTGTGTEVPWDTWTGRSCRVWPGKAYVCKGILGKLTKLLCLQLLCYVFQVLARTVERRRRDLYTLERGFDFLWSWDTICFDNYYWILYETFYVKMVVTKMKFLVWNLHCYKLVSEPWFERFGCTFGRIWTQTEDLRKFL